MAKRGRKAKSAYETYISAYKKDKKQKSSWYDSEMLSKAEFEIAASDFEGASRDTKVKEILHKQKWGYSIAEGKARKEFFETDLKGKVPGKWSEIRKMSHAEFTQSYGGTISELYDLLKSDKEIGIAGAKELISTYIFGSI